MHSMPMICLATTLYAGYMDGHMLICMIGARYTGLIICVWASSSDNTRGAGALSPYAIRPWMINRRCVIKPNEATACTPHVCRAKINLSRYVCANINDMPMGCANMNDMMICPMHAQILMIYIICQCHAQICVVCHYDARICMCTYTSWYEALTR